MAETSKNPCRPAEDEEAEEAIEAHEGALSGEVCCGQRSASTTIETWEVYEAPRGFQKGKKKSNSSPV